ncbi:uncharacterized protein LOC127985712 isoform X2 [Carassius gibelio]|uniref:uncharacterized protein LOC127985712 isoform X2 n=1 Tax=Carassius gibelio TaxID=101364 RepID=UPI002278CEBD|nr:uncharacterized protein LOC127985712 isoform X2 [Carassius gibelio]
MSPKRCVFGCEGKFTVFSFPKNPVLQQQWMQFVFPGQQRSVASAFVCSRHFTDECFINKAQVDAGFANRLLLKRGAVPVIKDTIHSTSTTREHVPSVKHTECQTEHRPTVSAKVQVSPLKISVGIQCTFAPTQKTVGTQFSFCKQTGHVRNKATQATVLSAKVSAETTQVETRRHLSSTPVKASTSGHGATPAKRPRIELLEEKDEDEGNFRDFLQPHHSTYKPVDSFAEASELRGMEVSCDYADAKYIVFESSLRELFETCPLCKHKCNVQRCRLGTFVSFSMVCGHCQYAKKWQSQPMRGSTPVGNLQMSAAVYFTGGSFIQMNKICRAMNLQIHHYCTFRRHARMFLEPSIYHKWKMDQQAMLQQLQPQGKIALSGDMRADSPGHSAKYGSYTLMHLESNKILDIQLSNEAGGIAHMEKEGLRRGLDLLESNNLHVEYIVTDRHTQVQKYLRERAVKQYYDVWHIERGLSKKLEKLSRNKECQVLRKWLPSIKNHMYWSAMSSKEGPEKVAKWKSLFNHIQNVHTHDSPEFPKCAHTDKVSRDRNKWLRPGTMLLYKVEKLLLNKRLLKDVKKLSHQYQTLALGAFHSVILRFAPKNVVFPYIGMLCRLYLAAMHFNENADREQTVNLEGTAVYKIMYPKSKKRQPTAQTVKTEPTCKYVNDLMRLLFTEVFDNPATFVEEILKLPIPADLSAEYDRPAKEDVIARNVARFNPVYPT